MPKLENSTFWVIFKHCEWWREMIRKRKVIFWLFWTLLCSDFCTGFFADNSCPQYATYFEALNTTTDCNGALPISDLGLTGDKFCEKICPQVSTQCLKLQKKSHSIRAKRATFTFWVEKSSLKMPKKVDFDEFLKTWNLQSNIVTRQVTFYIGQKLVKNGKIIKFKGDIFGDFQTVWCILSNMNLYPSDNFVFCLKILFGSSTFHESQAWFYSGQFFMIYQSSFDSFLQPLDVVLSFILNFPGS